MIRVFVGYDQREGPAYKACVRSLLARASVPVHVEPLLLPHLEAIGLYRRETKRDGRQLFDVISDAPMSTEFAISRFLVPHLCDQHGRYGWAVFCDADFLWRGDIADLMAEVPPTCAMAVVKHDQRPTGPTKMDGQRQTSYGRKNWSSLMVWNLGHSAHRSLTETRLNSARGLRLHQLDWIPNHLVAGLPADWNWLAGVSDPHPNPRAVHYTLGTPDMEGHENAPFAREWWRYAKDWWEGQRKSA